MVYEVKDKVFFITGAASGIGADVVRALVREDAKHVVIFDPNEKAGVALENELNSKYGKKVQFIKGDVTNDDEFVGSLKMIKETKGLDVLVNNAGIMNDHWDVYKKAIAVNVTALATGTLNALKLMRKDEGGNGGTIINIASVAALTQSPLLPIYFGAKSAVLHFSNCIGRDEYYSRSGVRVLAICFGRTYTALLDNVQTFDQYMESANAEELEAYPAQKSEDAAQGLLEAYKQGSSGSTWLITSGRPAEDISSNIDEAYSIMSRGVYE